MRGPRHRFRRQSAAVLRNKRGDKDKIYHQPEPIRLSAVAQARDKGTRDGSSDNWYEWTSRPDSLPMWLQARGGNDIKRKYRKGKYQIW